MDNNNKKKSSLLRCKTIIRFYILLLFLSTSVYATDVRGRIDFNARNGYFPMNGASVQLCLIGGVCLSYRTGYDGMYYFRTVSGNYDVIVNGKVVQKIFIPNQRYFDISPLLGN